MAESGVLAWEGRGGHLSVFVDGPRRPSGERSDRRISTGIGFGPVTHGLRKHSVALWRDCHLNAWSSGIQCPQLASAVRAVSTIKHLLITG